MITEKQENYLKVCILNRRQKAVSKKKKELTDYLMCPTILYFMFVRELQIN